MRELCTGRTRYVTPLAGVIPPFQGAYLAIPLVSASRWAPLCFLSDITILALCAYRLANSDSYLPFLYLILDSAVRAAAFRPTPIPLQEIRSSRWEWKFHTWEYLLSLIAYSTAAVVFGFMFGSPMDMISLLVACVALCIVCLTLANSQK